MKKIMALVLALTMALSLAACGVGSKSKLPGSPGANRQEQQPDSTPGPGADQKEQQPDSTPDSGADRQEQQPDSAPDSGSSQEEQNNNSDSMEALAENCCLPGLTAPDGCTFERAIRGDGVIFSKEGGFTSDEHKATIHTVWELCKKISPDGNYDVKNSLDTNTITETYSDITDKYAEYNETTLTDYEIYWHYTYNGKVRQVKILGGDSIEIVTWNMGTLESQ
ncbi:LptM family lipoprotein [Diplocloster modestus]|uniref:Lipoprotein n=1 Tax=Diplocloster modestus TaxID=2850322 RepID=A0ABS6KD55_9FIRM|nr:hypothetical protein [Diplocloster modestus]MBU9728449.1 hypothetical protein [Diplocloster modestus]